MTPFDFRPRTRVLFGSGEFARLGEVARELGGTRCLVVADAGMLETGHVEGSHSHAESAAHGGVRVSRFPGESHGAWSKPGARSPRRNASI